MGILSVTPEVHGREGEGARGVEVRRSAAHSLYKTRHVSSVVGAVEKIDVSAKHRCRRRVTARKRAVPIALRAGGIQHDAIRSAAGQQGVVAHAVAN